MSELDQEVEIREVIPSDTDFIYYSWLNSYKTTSYFAKRIRNYVFFFWHHKIVDRILNGSTARILVASPKNEPEVIIGYLVYEVLDPIKYKQDTDMEQKTKTIHYAFVKQDFRNHGMLKALLHKAEIDIDQAFFSHWTYDWNQIMEKHPQMIYDPYRI